VIKFLESFLKLKDYTFVFIFIYFDLKIDKKLQLQNISREIQDIKNYKNDFNSKNASILLKHNNKNYNINLLSRTKLLYKLLYILFEKKLNILQNYLLKKLMLNVRLYTNV